MGMIRCHWKCGVSGVRRVRCGGMERPAHHPPVYQSGLAVRSGAPSTPDGPRADQPPVPPARASAAASAAAAAAAAATVQAKVQVDQQPASPATNKLSPATIFKNIFKSVACMRSASSVLRRPPPAVCCGLLPCPPGPLQ